MKRSIILTIMLLGITRAGGATLGASGEYYVDRFLLDTSDTVSSTFVDSVCTANGWGAATSATPELWVIALPDTMAADVVDSVEINAVAPIEGASLDWVAYVPDLETGTRSSPLPDILRLPEIDGYQNDWYYDQWPLGEEFLNVVDAWDLSTGSSNTVVAIVDTGIDLYHPEWASRIGNDIQVFSCVGDDGHDTDGHGTAVAGLILAAHDGYGIHGVAPSVTAEVYKVLDDNGVIPMSSITDALEMIASRAAANPSKNYIVNMSVGLDGSVSPGHVYVGELADRLRDLESNQNVLIVAAAGNQGVMPGLEPDPCAPMRWVAYPGALSGETAGPFYSEDVDEVLVTVGASTVFTGPNLLKIKAADYTCWAGVDTCEMIVDVSAPGGDGEYPMPVCVDGGGYDHHVMKTSGATAMISGVAALMFSVDPYLTPAQVKALLRHDSKFRTSAGLTYLADGCLRNKNFTVDYEEHCGTVLIPDDPPGVWPDGEYRTASLDRYDEWASPVFGSGMPDCRTILADIGGGGCSYFLDGGSITATEDLWDCTTVFLYGDLEVAYGGQLRLNAPAGASDITLRVAACDALEGGDDPDHVELVVENGGRLVSSTDLKLRQQIRGDANQMAGMVCETGGTVEVAGRLDLFNTLGGLRVEPAATVTADAFFAESATWALTTGSDLVFETVGCRSSRGFLLQDAAVTLTAATTNYLICETPALASSALKLEGDSEVLGSGTLDLSGWRYGVFVAAGPTVDVTLPEIVAVECVNGLFIESARDVLLGAPVSFVCDPGTANFVGMKVLAADRVQTTGAGSLVLDDYTTGILVQATGAEIGGAVTVQDARGHAVEIDAADGVSLTGLTVLDAAQSGVQVTSASAVTITDLQAEGCDVGVNILDSQVTVRGSVFESNGSGVLVGPTGYADLGDDTTGDQGDNTFGASTDYHVGNLNYLTPSIADGNTWYYRGSWTCPPNPAKILGAVRTLCY